MKYRLVWMILFESLLLSTAQGMDDEASKHLAYLMAIFIAGDAAWDFANHMGLELFYRSLLKKQGKS